MKKRAYTRADGNVSVVTFAPNAKRPGETDEDFIEREWARIVEMRPEAATFTEVDDLPPRKHAQGYSQRRQWRLKNGQIEVDATAPNLDKDIFDKEKEIEVLENKANPSDADIVSLKRKEMELKKLIKQQ